MTNSLEIAYMQGLADLTDRQIAATPIGELEAHASRNTGICFLARVHRAHENCAGLDFDTWFERTQDAAS